MIGKLDNEQAIVFEVKPILQMTFFMIILAIFPLNAHALTPNQIFEKVKDSVFVIKNLDAHGKVKGQGSGVLIPSGKIATNCHVVEGGVSYQVGQNKKFVNATLFAEDRDKDVCLLEPMGFKGKPVQLDKAASLKVGVPVYAVGAPRGLELSLSSGIVAQLRGGPPPLIQTTTAISPGSSGGGLFDQEGRLIGLTTLYLEGGQSLNFALPAEWIDEITPGRKTSAKGYGPTEWLKRAVAMQHSKDWIGLLAWCQDWTKNSPDSADAWFGVGVAYSNLKRYDEAFEAYRHVLRIKPDRAEAYYSIGIDCVALKRYDEALEAYRQVLLIDSKHVNAWQNIGVTLYDLNRKQDAIEAYHQALRIKPDYAPVLKNLGTIYVEIGHYHEALEAYRQVLRISPEDSDAWFGVGVAYSNLKRYDDSIAALRQGLRFHPDHAGGWNYLGITYALSGNRTGALEAIRELKRLDPKKAEKLFDLIVPR